MLHRLATVAILVVAIAATAGCRTEDNTVPEPQDEDRIIQTATLVDDSTIFVTWDAVECETFLGVESDLNDDFANLRIRVRVDIANCPPPGAASATVILSEPLGNRRIWDRAFGNTVALEP